MNNKKGITMIEALLASVIVATSFLAYMKYKQIELKENIMKEFEYDFRNLLNAFESKIEIDNLSDKKYWTDYPFDDFNNHVYKNFLDKNSKCEKSGEIDLNGHDYIKCFDAVRYNIFKVDIKGDISFYKNDNIKVYSIDFIPKNKNELKNINYLSKSIKRAIAGKNFYSNIDYFTGNERTDYVKCLDAKDICYLRFTMGTDANYLDPEKITIKHEDDDDDFSVFGGYQENGVFNSENRKKTLESTYNDNSVDNSIISGDYNYDKRNLRDETQLLKDELKSYGLDLSNKEANDLKKEIEKIKKSPELMKKIEENLELICSQYDEDDYYYMHLYDNQNMCYKYYNKE